jgi:glycine cleavage system H protein
VVPDDLKYTREHEWVKVVGDRTVRVGITHFAQEALGDVVFVTLPATGAAVELAQAFGEVESTKSVSDLYAPVAGTVSSCNYALESQPELVNSDPYGEGWIVEIEVGDAAELDSGELLSAADYSAHISA